VTAAVATAPVSTTPNARPFRRNRGVAIGELLERAHEETQAHGVAECPVCSGDLRAQSHGVRCADCGTRLF